MWYKILVEPRQVFLTYLKGCQEVKDFMGPGRASGRQTAQQCHVELSRPESQQPVAVRYKEGLLGWLGLPDVRDGLMSPGFWPEFLGFCSTGLLCNRKGMDGGYISEVGSLWPLLCYFFWKQQMWERQKYSEFIMNYAFVCFKFTLKLQCFKFTFNTNQCFKFGVCFWFMFTIVVSYCIHPLPVF